MPPAIALYIHWPFCKKKCPYCDFNSHVRTGGFDEVAYLTALLKEMDHWANRGTKGRVCSSVFFGGGTPSLMKVVTVEAILQKANDLWPFQKDIEITLEANPTSVEAAKFEGLRSIGVNRLSMGIQSLDDEVLQFLGREHSVAEALKALALAQTHFDNVNFDLIYARPHQNKKDWLEELNQALAYGCSHMSLYQLTIEPDTRFETLYAQGKLKMPDDHVSADFYEATNERMKEAGLPLYEISNYAKAGLECQHNLTYWRYQDYLGLGPGAHGRVTIGDKLYSTMGIKRPEAWSQQAMAQGHGLEVNEVLSAWDAATEMILMGLRTVEGLHLTRLKDRFGAHIQQETLDRLTLDGLLQPFRGDHLQTAIKGQLLLNSVIGRLVDDLKM